MNNNQQFQQNIIGPFTLGVRPEQDGLLPKGAAVMQDVALYVQPYGMPIGYDNQTNSVYPAVSLPQAQFQGPQGPPFIPYHPTLPPAPMMPPGMFFLPQQPSVRINELVSLINLSQKQIDDHANNMFHHFMDEVTGNGEMPDLYKDLATQCLKLNDLPYFKQEIGAVLQQLEIPQDQSSTEKLEKKLSLLKMRARNLMFDRVNEKSAVETVKAKSAANQNRFNKDQLGKSKKVPKPQYKERYTRYLKVKKQPGKQSNPMLDFVNFQK